MTEQTAPTPIPDSDSQPYWNALREHRVTFQRCGACGAAQLYFRSICKHCQSDELSIEESSGDGTVYSYTFVHHVGNPVLNEETPYVLAIVEMAEGPRVVTRVDAEVGTVDVGDAVRATFRDVDEETTLLHYAPTG